MVLLAFQSCSIYKYGCILCVYNVISHPLYYDTLSACRPKLKWLGGVAVFLIFEELFEAKLMFCLYIVILGCFMFPLKKGKNLEENLAPIFEETAALSQLLPKTPPSWHPHQRLGCRKRNSETTTRRNRRSTKQGKA